MDRAGERGWEHERGICAEGSAVTLTDARSRELLEERARVLARPLAPEHPGATLALVTFGLADETYGIEARHVCGVFRLTDLAPLPGAEAALAGLTGWRGDLLTVLDLRVLLGLPAAGLDDRAWVVAVGRERPAFGLLAGALRDLVTVRGDQMSPPRDGDGRRLVRGVTRDAVQVVDIESIMAARA